MISAKYILYVLMPLSLFSQPASFNAILKEKNDSIRCVLLVEASDYYKFHSVDTLIMVADELITSAQKLRSDSFLESGYNVKSLGLKFKGEYGAATEYAQAALDLNSKTANKINRAKILLNYADLMRQQKQYEVCERYHREGLSIAKQANDSALMARFYINSGLMFSNMGKTDSAFVYYKNGIAITDKVDALKNTGITARLNLSQLYYLQGNYSEMIKMANEVYKYAIQEEDEDHISLGATNVAIGYLKLGDFDKALEYIGRAEDAAKKYNSPQNLLLALGNASDIYAEKGDYKSAYHKALAYIGLKDSLRSALYDRNLTEMTTKYELKEKENQLTQHQLTIQKQAARQKLVIWISLVLILSVVLLFFYLKNRQELKRKTAEAEAEKARLTAELEHTKLEKMEEMDQLRSRFFANISHEFRTPLTLILNPVDRLLGVIKNAEHHRYLDMIRSNAVRLLELVNQLLDLSKLESGKERLTIGKYDIKKFCLAVGAMFESLGHQKNIQFNINVPENETIGYFDRDKMHKIIANLLSNAFKFTPSGGIVQLSLTLGEPELACISVKDTGMGISLDNQAVLFERFMSFSGSEIQKSSGIGLSLVKELVQLHKGTIHVHSEIGKGSEFIVKIPLSKEKYQDAVENEKPEDPAWSDTNISSLTQRYDTPGIKMPGMPDLESASRPLLLIAEDNPDVSSLIIDICNLHFQVITAENGRSALAMAIEKVPDIIITDVMMPEMDGMQLCESLRSNDLTSHIPIIMLTARGDRQDKLTGLKTGADDYLTKPFDNEELIVRLQNLLERRRKLQEHFKRVLHAFVPVDVDAKSIDATFLQNLKKKIENKMHDENYGVSELASDLALSRSQLHRKVSGLLGLSPNEIIRNMRLEKARMLIRKNTGTIAEIAYGCGFSSPAYFAKCYKDYFGHTAGEE